jgi:aspartyl/asparaginyl-tRNA synthetase
MEGPWLTLEDVTELAKEEVRFLIERVLAKHEEDLKFLGRDVSKLKLAVSKPFPIG